MTSNWYFIKPFANGYLGVSKAGEFWAKERKELIKRLIWTTYTKKTGKATR